jgi:hypothetical protein
MSTLKRESKVNHRIYYEKQKKEKSNSDIRLN